MKTTTRTTATEVQVKTEAPGDMEVETAGERVGGGTENVDNSGTHRTFGRGNGGGGADQGKGSGGKAAAAGEEAKQRKEPEGAVEVKGRRSTPVRKDMADADKLRLLEALSFRRHGFRTAWTGTCAT